MRQIANVRGSQEVVTNIEVNVDTVYVRSNIERIETEEFTGWQYDEIQYTVCEYIELLANRQEIGLETPMSEIYQVKVENLELRETIDFILTDLIPSLFE